MNTTPRFRRATASTTRLALALTLALLIPAACETDESTVEIPFAAHEEASDFVPVVVDEGKADALGSRFDRNRLVPQNFFLAADLVDGDDVQAFLEKTPYGFRSWLADETIGDKRVADAIVDASRDSGINPIVMLARMQGEQSLIARTTRPTRSHTIDFAFGCGCPDGQDCGEKFRGLDKQIACAAQTLRARHDDSVDGSGWWRAGVTHKTLDRQSVTPANHATAALYAYTPWLSEEVGGNWLLWNITRRFALAFHDAELIDMDDPRLDDPFVGTPCERDEHCLFEAAGLKGSCLASHEGQAADGAFCVLPCEGLCPDMSGRAYTFCASLDGGVSGLCVSQSRRENKSCAAISGTEEREADRFVGNSAALEKTSTVCLPLAE